MRPQPRPRLRRIERDPIWRREMRERWRRPITLYFLLMYVAGFCWFGYSLYTSLVIPNAARQGGELAAIGHQLFVTLMGIQICAWIPIALLLSAPTIAAERQRNSFIEYILAGLQPRQILRAKFAAITTFIVVVCTIPLPVMAIYLPLGGTDPLEIVAGGLFEIAVAIFSTAVGLVISTHNRDVGQAMKYGIVASFVLLGSGTLMLPSLLEASFLSWLMLSGALVGVAFLMLTICEDSLNQIARNLEQEDRANGSRLSVSPPAPSPFESPQYRELLTYQAHIAPSRPKPAVLAYELSPLEQWLETLASRNAVTLREFRVAVRNRNPFFDLAAEISLAFWIGLGILGALLLLMIPIPSLWMLPMLLATGGALLSAAVSASATFTREREQQMVTQLQLCPMHPWEIVAGKVAATLLVVARSWGGPLIALSLMSLALGPLVSLSGTLFIGLLLLWATLLSTNFSLLGRHTAIATTGTVSVLVGSFILLPLAPITIGPFAPSLRPLLDSPVLNALWIDPITVLVYSFYSSLFDGVSLGTAFLQLDAVLLVLNILALGTATRIWSQARFNDATTGTGTRFWERDLTRSWR